MIRGEAVLVTKDYDLFDYNVNGCSGIYIEMSESTGKHLIYFPINQEWAELSADFFELVDPGKIPDDNLAFIKNVRKL